MSSRFSSSGFTLIELMIVVMVIAIFSLIAIPSYQSYARTALESQVQQEIQNLAMRLERHKSRNFNYKNFETTQVVIPSGATGKDIKYTLEIRNGVTTRIPRLDPDTNTPIIDPDTNEPLTDDVSLLLTDERVSGQNWVIKAEATNEKNFNYLLSSQGIRCRNKAKANVTFTGCLPAGTERW